MSNQHTEAHGSHEAHGSGSHGSVKSYVIGFVLSIIFTIIPLAAVMNHWLNKTGTIALIMAMAVIQLLIQLIFFMHLKEEEKPRYNLMALLVGTLIVVTVVAGSIWIMTYNTPN